MNPVGRSLQVPAGGVALDADLVVPEPAGGVVVFARSHYLVKGRSNLSDASLVFNEALPYSLCLR